MNRLCSHVTVITVVCFTMCTIDAEVVATARVAFSTSALLDVEVVEQRNGSFVATSLASIYGTFISPDMTEVYGRLEQPCMRELDTNMENDSFIAFYVPVFPIRERTCQPLMEELQRVVYNGAVAVIVDITANQSFFRQQLQSVSIYGAPLIAVVNKDGLILQRALWKATRPSCNACRVVVRVSALVNGEQFVSGQDEIQYFKLVIFIGAVIVIVMIVVLVMLKVKCGRRRSRQALESDITKTILHKMATRKYRADVAGSDLDVESCAICLEQFANGQVLRVLPCGHQFHRCCVDPWLVANRKCPLCLFDIVESRFSVQCGMQIQRLPESVATTRDAQHSVSENSNGNMTSLTPNTAVPATGHLINIDERTLHDSTWFIPERTTQCNVTENQHVCYVCSQCRHHRFIPVGVTNCDYVPSSFVRQTDRCRFGDYRCGFKSHERCFVHERWQRRDRSAPMRRFEEINCRREAALRRAIRAGLPLLRVAPLSRRHCHKFTDWAEQERFGCDVSDGFDADVSGTSSETVSSSTTSKCESCSLLGDISSYCSVFGSSDVPSDVSSFHSRVYSGHVGSTLCLDRASSGKAISNSGSMPLLAHTGVRQTVSGYDNSVESKSCAEQSSLRAKSVDSRGFLSQSCAEDQEENFLCRCNVIDDSVCCREHCQSFSLDYTVHHCNLSSSAFVDVEMCMPSTMTNCKTQQQDIPYDTRQFQQCSGMRSSSEGLYNFHEHRNNSRDIYKSDVDVEPTSSFSPLLSTSSFSPARDDSENYVLLTPSQSSLSHCCPARFSTSCDTTCMNTVACNTVGVADNRWCMDTENNVADQRLETVYSSLQSLPALS